MAGCSNKKESGSRAAFRTESLSGQAASLQTRLQLAQAARDRLSLQLATYRNSLGICELYLDENLNINGFSDEFPSIVPGIKALSGEHASLSRLIEDQAFERIRKFFNEVKALGQLPDGDETAWSLKYTGPSERESIGSQWRVSSCCSDKNWTIGSRDGQPAIIHLPHIEDDNDCYLILTSWQDNPGEDVKIVYHARTPDDPRCIRDLSCVLNGSLDYEQNPDRCGYTVCTGSNYNQEARIVRRLCKVVSLPEILAPATGYRIEIVRSGGRISRSLFMNDNNRLIGTIKYIDHDPLCFRPGSFGVFTFSGGAEFYGMEIYSRPSKYGLNRYKVPFDIETSLRPLVSDKRVYRLHLAWDDKPGRNLHRLLFEDVTSRRAAEDLVLAQRDLSTRLGAVTGIKEALELCLETALEVSGMDCGGVYLVNERKGLDLLCSRGLPEDFLELVSSFTSEDFNTRLVMQCRPLYLHYSDLMSEKDQHRKYPQGSHLKALSSIPVLHEGEVIACINTASSHADEIRSEAKRALEALATQIGGVIARIKAEESSRAHRADLLNLFDRIDDMLFILDQDGRIIDVNPAVCRILSYSKDQLIGRLMIELHPEDSRAEAARSLLKMMSGKRGICLIPFLTSDGRLVPVETRTSRGRWGNREVLFGICRDITERIQAEKALYESERKYQDLAESTSDIVYSMNAEGIISYLNPQIRRYGFEPEELIGRHFLEMILAEDREDVLADFHRTMLTAKEFPSIFRFRDKAGEVHWIEENGMVQLDSRGHVRGITGVLRDVTGRKKAEEALRESEARYRAVVEDQTEMIARFLPDGRITFANRAVCRYYGKEPDDIIGINLFPFIFEADREKVFNSLMALTPDNPVLSMENRVNGPGGEVRWHLWTNRAIFDSDGRLLEFQAVGRDMTETRMIEEERIKSEKLFSLGVLAGGIAHDFNNLLGAVMINISMARKALTGNTEVLDLIRDMEEASLRARDLTQQLLTFSKGGAPIRKPTCINDLIRHSTRFALRGSNVRCELDLDPEPWDADIDSGQISQVVHNLVINASQAMPAGGVIHVSTRNVALAPGEIASLAPGKYIRVTVRDHGRGIPPDIMPHIFDPYFTSKTHGSGLGLATSYSIIHRHQGHIAARSEPGKGAEFTFHLPAAEEQSGKHPRRESSKHKKPVTGRILVMDDEPLYRESLARALISHGHQVRTARNGLEAIELYETEFGAGRSFDLVIMDLTIPGGMGGKETLASLRRIDPQVRAVVSSGYSNDQILADFKRYGFCGIIPKPYRVEELIEVVSSVMENNPVQHPEPKRAHPAPSE